MSKSWARNKQSGFTLVELLIVIVVIAILAAITLVSYNGIQIRASNTQTTQVVSEYVKALGIYAVDNGGYPAATGCLGDSYPAPSHVCLSQGGTNACFGLGASASMALNTALKPYMGNVPAPSMQAAACGGTTYVGAYAQYFSANRTMRVFMILRGNQNCPRMSPNSSSPGKSYSGDATLCSYTLANVV